MKQSNRERLERYRSQYQTWVNSQYLNLSADAKAEILQIIRAEWDAGYSPDLWCGSCVAKMLVYAFEQMDADKTDSMTINFER